MSMRVKMILDLIANTKGAKQAQAGVKGVKDEARKLDGATAGRRISRDFLNLTSNAKAATRSLKETKAASTALGQNSGAERLSRHLQRSRQEARRLAAELKNVKTQQAAAAKAVASTEGGKGGSTLFAGTRAMVGGYLGIQGARMAARATVGQSISFEKAMAEVRKKVDGMDDPAELAKMERAVSKWAIAYGRAREEVASLVAEAGAGGVTLKDMPEFVRINLAAATAWDATADKTSNALAKIRAATGWGNKELEEFVDKVNALADSGSAKEMDVVDMFQRAGAAAKAAGVDFDTSLAFLTAMNNVAIAPEVAARGFNAFASKLRTATDQGDKVEEGLKALGLTPKGVEKGMKADAKGTMIDVLQRLEKSADKASVAIKVFGREWWDEVARAGQALPEIRKSLDIVTDRKKWSGSAQNNLNIELSTTDKHLKRLSALTSEVGDRLGRWALPGINEGIEKIIAGMDELDRRSAERSRLRAEAAAEDATAEKIVDGAALTAEERERMARDAAYRNRVSGAAGDKRTDRANVGLNNGLRIGELERDRDALMASIANRRAAGADESQLAYSVTRLEAILDEIRAIDPSRAPAKAARDPRRPADQDERGRADRGEALALLERVRQLEAKLAAIEALKGASTNAGDRAGYEADATGVRTRLGAARRPGGQFGFGPGGVPVSAEPKGAGPGMLSFRPSMKNWASSVLGAQDIDLGEAGITIAESLAQGLRQGGGSAETAAQGIRTGITGAFSGADLSAAGAQMMATLEQGITAGGDRAVAAAQRVAGRVKGALANGGRQSLGGALHDGVE
ncbi:MAG: phage tail tape measure protein [Chelatococcus sp.]|nr:MAG: phage tail tape measure protein [Chelatococcus sp.]